MTIDDMVKMYLCFGMFLTLVGLFIYITSWGEEAEEKWGARLFFGGFLWPCLAGYFVLPFLIWLVKALGSMWKSARWANK